MFGDVDSSGERIPVPCDHYRADCWFRIEALDGVVEITGVVRTEGVQLLRSVEVNRANVAVLTGLDGGVFGR